MGNLYSVKLEYDDRELRRSFNSLDRRLNDGISALFNYNAPYATGWMKTHAPWTDDTGAARASLVALANNFGHTHEMLLAHGVHYGIWLEVANNRRYEILESAQRHIAEKLMREMESVFKDAVT